MSSDALNSRSLPPQSFLDRHRSIRNPNQTQNVNPNQTNPNQTNPKPLPPRALARPLAPSPSWRITFCHRKEIEDLRDYYECELVARDELLAAARASAQVPFQPPKSKA